MPALGAPPATAPAAPPAACPPAAGVPAPPFVPAPGCDDIVPAAPLAPRPALPPVVAGAPPPGLPPPELPPLVLAPSPLEPAPPCVAPPGGGSWELQPRPIRTARANWAARAGEVRCISLRCKVARRLHGGQLRRLSEATNVRLGARGYGHRASRVSSRLGRWRKQALRRERRRAARP